MGRPTKAKTAQPGRGQFPTTAEEEEFLTQFIESEKHERGANLSRAQAIRMIFHMGIVAAKGARA